MCGRYANVASTSVLTAEFDVTETIGDDLPPSWNIAPTDPVRIVLARHPAGDRSAPAVRQLRTARWGLVPSWSRSRAGGARMINARSETVATTRAFRAAAARRRCLVPALGYYEWSPEGRRTIPYFLHAAGDEVLAMAGLYEIRRDDSLPDDDPDRWLWSVTIITRPAAGAVGAIHDRCPVFVPRDLRGRWLDCDTNDPRVAVRLLDAMPERHLQPRRVSKAVGNVRNDGPGLIEPVAGDDDSVLYLSSDGDGPLRLPGADTTARP